MKQGKPMARGTSRMRATKPASEKPKRAARATGEDKLCRGQPCYLAVIGTCTRDIATVVPCHSNQARHGKGTSLKALDIYTVPGCRACHAEIDQGRRFTKAEKFAIWDVAFARWEVDRSKLMTVA
jgi:hypothetical protein